MAISCGGCGKFFSSQTLFDQHRVGSYGEAIYSEKDLEKDSKKRPIAYTPHTRHCMTTEEMIEAGYQFEHKMMTVYVDGRDHREEREVWFDPVAREKMRAAFRKDEPIEEEV